MKYKDLHLLILALAVIHVQAAPERTTETTETTNFAAEIDGLIDNAVAQMTDMIMNTPIMQNFSCLAKQILTAMLPKAYPKDMMYTLQGYLTRALKSQVEMMKDFCKFMMNLMLTISNARNDIMNRINGIMGVSSSELSVHGTNSNGGGTGGNGGISKG